MRLIDIYNEYKKRYDDAVILLESGIFYDVFNNDVGVINRLLGYKIKLSGNVYSIGFPSSSLDKVTRILKSSHINYIVLNKKDETYEIKEQMDYDDNNYFDFEIDYNRLVYLNKRIDRINDKLRDRIFSNDLESLLLKIEKFI